MDPIWVLVYPLYPIIHRVSTCFNHSPQEYDAKSLAFHKLEGVSAIKIQTVRDEGMLGKCSVWIQIRITVKNHQKPLKTLGFPIVFLKPSYQPDTWKQKVWWFFAILKNLCRWANMSLSCWLISFLAPHSLQFSSGTELVTRCLHPAEGFHQQRFAKPGGNLYRLGDGGKDQTPEDVQCSVS